MSLSSLLTSPLDRPSSPPRVDDAPPTIESAIKLTLPTANGQRNRSIFNFARKLKAIPSLADAELDSLRPVVLQWHEAALPQIATKEFDETWADFIHAFGSVKFPDGEEPIRMIYEQSISRPLPTCAKRYTATSLHRCVLLCRELQRVSGDQPFFLGCRTAGDLLGITHVLAHKWLRLLEADGVLRVEKRGTQGHATRFRYLGD